MSETMPKPACGAFAPRPRTIHGIVAEFAEPDALLVAARRARDAGYTSGLDAFTPFPLDELPEILAWPRSRMPRVFLIAGAVGGLSAFFMMWFANVVHYPINVGGRPLNSWPAWIPITFETTVLFAGLAGASGMLFRNGLPRPHHPVFEVPDFERSGRDRFFLIVEAADRKFDAAATRDFMHTLDAERVTEVYE